MTSGDLGILIELQKQGSFAAAGRALGVSHTTVSRKLKELEAHFGTRLAERIGEQVVLTAEGERAAGAARRIDEELSVLERQIKGVDGRLSGRITLTTVDILAWHYMPVFSAFCERYPDIELSLSTDPQVRSLSRREAEMALRLTNAPEPYLFGREIERMTFSAYALADRFEGHGGLNSLPWLDYGHHECMTRSADWMRRHAPEGRIRSLVPTPLMMLKAVETGMGAGALPDGVAEGSPGLVKLSDDPCFSIGVWLLAPSELRNTARVRAVFDCFRAPVKGGKSGKG